ncbi:transcription factor [Pelomyxa schiedti]|nr:transcription factor [Pelomyxa schiedti]
MGDSDDEAEMHSMRKTGQYLRTVGTRIHPRKATNEETSNTTSITTTSSSSSSTATTETTSTTSSSSSPTSEAPITLTQAASQAVSTMPAPMLKKLGLDHGEDAPQLVLDETELAKFLPTQFGKRKEKVDMAAEFKNVARRPSAAAKSSAPTSTASTTSSAKPGAEGIPAEFLISKEEQIRFHTEEFRRLSTASSTTSTSTPTPAEDENAYFDNVTLNHTLPVSHEITLGGHEKAVSALALDAGGARLLTGGHDYMVLMWDFAGMDQRFRSFRSIEPAGGHIINQLNYSSNGKQWVCASGSAQAKIFDRDAFPVGEFVKGDQYLSDLNNTKGHVATVTNAMWNPADPETMMTSSLDGTVRIWNVKDIKKQKIVIKAKGKALRTRHGVSASCYSVDGRLICGAAQVEGSIQVWSSTGPYHRPTSMVERAHTPGSAVSSLAFSRDSRMIVSRCLDDTLKVWDLRSFKAPVKEFEGLQNFFPHTDVIFSPNDEYILTGTSIRKGEGASKLVVIRKSNLEIVSQLDQPDASVIRLLWHPKINQLIMGLSSGQVKVFFDPKRSEKGAIMSLSKGKAKADLESALNQYPHSEIVLPDEDDVYDIPSRKRERDQPRRDPVRSRKPDLPVGEPGVNGTLRSSLTQHLLKNLVVDQTRNEDPREAILKHAQTAENKPFFFAGYAKTQPNPVLAPPDPEPEEPEEKKSRLF